MAAPTWPNRRHTRRSPLDPALPVKAKTAVEKTAPGRLLFVPKSLLERPQKRVIRTRNLSFVPRSATPK
jgi:hypothetical protein